MSYNAARGAMAGSMTTQEKRKCNRIAREKFMQVQLFYKRKFVALRERGKENPRPSARARVFRGRPEELGLRGWSMCCVFLTHHEVLNNIAEEVIFRVRMDKVIRDKTTNVVTYARFPFSP